MAQEIQYKYTAVKSKPVAASRAMTKSTYVKLAWMAIVNEWNENIYFIGIDVA